MKRQSILKLILAILLTPVLAYGVGAPKEIGGFKLGEDITDYPEIEASNFLREVVVNDLYGFRKGIISYGTCAYPGKIVKIQMKYENSSKAFYDELLKRYKKKYGKPTEWKGDAFGILYIWKWRFYDEEGRQVNLLLQHNLQNHNQNIGNQVKLSYPERLEEERFCFIEFCEENKTEEQRALIEERKKPDWDYMVPR